MRRRTFWVGGSLAGAGEQAVLTWGNPHLNAHRPLIAELALKHRVPVIYDVRYPGSPREELMVYGPRVAEVVREAAGHIDKILKGANPAELPIGRAKTFELVVNRKTAKALGVTLPLELILRADEVIE
jgi:putative ABC transport system substrate-binding protein